MRNGPWDSEHAIRKAIADRKIPKSITGANPIGVESCGDQARFIYSDPHKEPLSITKFPPFKHYYRSSLT